MGVRMSEGTRNQLYMNGRPIEIVELKTITVERTYGMFGQNIQEIQFTIPRDLEDCNAEYDRNSGKLKLEIKGHGCGSIWTEIDPD